jgi:PPM family protein phosphatase
MWSALQPTLAKVVSCSFSAMVVDLKKIKPGIEVASLTDVGRQRANNEDSYLYWEPESEKEFLRKGRLAVIADGMGGYEGGQEASRLAVETVRHIYDGDFDDDPQAALTAAFGAAHENIQRYAVEHPEFHGMGTTCTAVAVIGPELYFAHVGDSRLYRVRGANVSRLTRDHSYVGRLVESGIVRAEDAESHPQRHILTAALGSGREVVPDVPAAAVKVEKGDSFVLCTDGLWGLVSEAELAQMVNGNTPNVACHALVQAALDRGGPDNVTVIILHISE